MKIISIENRLRRSILAFSMLSTLVVGTMVAFLAIYPMYGQLRQQADLNLNAALQTRKLAIEQALDKYTATALQITSRSRLRQMLEKYNNGEIDLKALKADSKPKLEDALNMSDFGTGLGLTICKKLAEMMNAQITLLSSVGHGSTFQLLLKDVEAGPVQPLTAKGLIP